MNYRRNDGPPGIIETIGKEGTISTLWGPPGAGKTSIACTIMEQAVNPKRNPDKDYSQIYNIWTIIHFFDEDQIDEAIEKGLLKIFYGDHEYRKLPSEIHTITSLSQLLFYLIDNEGENITILDEAGIIAGSASGGTSNKAKTMKNLCFVIRHFNTSLILIGQSKGSVLPALREDLVTYEMRIREVDGVRYFTIAKAIAVRDEFGEEHVNFEQMVCFGGVTPTTLPFDSKFMPGFLIDLDLEQCFNELSQLGNTLNIRKNGKEVIKKLHNQWLLKQEKKERRLMGIEPDTNKKTTELVNNIISKYDVTKTEAYVLAGEKLRQSPSWVRNHYIKSKKYSTAIKTGETLACPKCGNKININTKRPRCRKCGYQIRKHEYPVTS
ncbi:MAG TPA: hypothetical protein VMY59_08275 [Candidatus Thermoplasmatota archaeon]|nr:hypothetical protein [Candidatus Thermoplasmatota archaeon]